MIIILDLGLIGICVGVLISKLGLFCNLFLSWLEFLGSGLLLESEGN